MRRKASHPTLKRPVLISAGLHLFVVLLLVTLPGSIALFQKPIDVTWVELPKGSSEEIGIGIKKATTLPRSTIQEQKQPPTPEQTPLTPSMRRPSDEVADRAKEGKEQMEEPTKTATKEKPAPPKPKTSAADKTIASALAKIDRQLKQRSAAPEAAQIDESGEGYKYGTGTEPLRVSPDNPDYLKYQAMVRYKIINEWVVPPIYAEEDMAPNLRAQLEVMINTDGEVISMQWHSRSGNQAFDASALRAVQRASPFPTPPSLLEWEAYNEGFLIEFDPRLKP